MEMTERTASKRPAQTAGRLRKTSESLTKAAAAVALLLLPEITAPAQLYVEPQKDYNLSIYMTRSKRGRAQQGLEQWGGYIFSLEDGGHVNVYDFKKASPDPVGEFELASSRPDNHANNAEFGVETAKGAGFPLLYVTNGKPGSEIEFTCFVESITKKGRKWSSEVAQTITLDESGFAAKGYVTSFGCPSWLVDRERQCIWTFSARQRTVPKVTRNNYENQYIATKFRIPALKEGPIVTLGADDILDQVVFPYEIGFTQAGCCHKGKIYYCFGVGKDPARPSHITVFDTDSRKICARYDLSEDIKVEMEDIFIEDGWMYVNANTKENPPIFRLSLPKSPASDGSLVANIKADPERAGGIYYIDPFYDIVCTPAPEGYKPFYITGYYRHGARQMDDPWTYPDVYNSLHDAHAGGTLTPMGEAIWKRVEQYWPNLSLRLYDFTMKGHVQSKASGRRTADFYPEVFEGDPYMKTISTSAQRVSETMHAWNLGVQSRFPDLDWDIVEASGSSIRYMNPYADGNPDKLKIDQILRDYRGEWYKKYRDYACSMFNPDDLLSRLFTNPEEVKMKYDSFDLGFRFWLAASVMQGLEKQVPLWDVFTEKEIIGWTKAENYKYYMQKGPHPVNLGRGWGYGTRILRALLDEARENISLGRHGVDMHFGHDGVLMATLCALQADNWDGHSTDPDEIAQLWQVWNIPMGASLQLVFYRSETDPEILVKPLINERDCELKPFKAVNGHFYRWSEMYPYYQARCDEADKSLSETAGTDISVYTDKVIMHFEPQMLPVKERN